MLEKLLLLGMGSLSHNMKLYWGALSQDPIFIRSLLLENLIQPGFCLCLIFHVGLMNKENNLGLLEFRSLWKGSCRARIHP